MWYEIFKFEFKYRVKRPETYVFFVFLLLFSMVGVDFIFQGVDLGIMKKNAPLVIGKTMGAITGIFMILVSMIMGVPILRDYQYNTESILFVNPISKRDYLLGRFLGSYVILLFIFSGILFGMMIGSQMPWHKASEMLAFNPWTYIQTFIVVVLPTLFFGACTFYVTGMLSKNLMVVYTQGIILFVIFLLTKAITNEYLQGIFDPFSLTTLTQYSKEWINAERNSMSIAFNGILLHNKVFWSLIGILVAIYGYRKFSFSQLVRKTKKKEKKREVHTNNSTVTTIIPSISLQFSFKSKIIQLKELTKFYTLSILKETAFWAIVICGIIIILINSISLGTVYDVDSYPATHFIMAELQEMSMYFFIIILLFYSGEIIWKERTIKQNVLNDSTPIHNLIILVSKLLALNAIYVVLMLSLICTGILFQLSQGYYQLDLQVYFTGFFIEILPYLFLYTVVTFFFQITSKNKFIGIFLTLLFFIGNIASEYFGFNHSLYKYGGKTLGIYSEMNGYGHFLKPYLWIKTYWIVFAGLLLILSSLIMNRGTEISLWKRIKNMKSEMKKSIQILLISLTTLFILIGSYIFYNTNVLNEYWTNEEEQTFRASYEKELKQFEYKPQPKITDVTLNLELYPEKRSNEVDGSYTLKNTSSETISEIHIQKRIASHLQLKNVKFDRDVVINSKYQKFDYIIYQLQEPLKVRDSIQMKFTQTYYPKGFEEDGSKGDVIYNGTFFNNNVFPTLGYNKKYELSDDDIRTSYDLPKRQREAQINDINELINARTGSDSDGISLDITIGTSSEQTAVTSGKLVKHWKANNRNYFHYTNESPIINFYPIVSAEYEVKKDVWKSNNTKVDLEIYHHQNHTYNLDRMLHGMKASLDYFSSNFSPYQYEQLRIMEFPRYADFAQSLPNVIPFSEAMGFVLDIDDENDVNMVFYITAHEIAHQWFGMQIEAANVKGQKFVLETLAQYGAIMVLQKEFSEEKVHQFLELQKERYLIESKKAIAEPTLALVENEDYVYYYKGVIAMYELQKLIGEEQINKALRQFIKDWRSYSGEIKSTTNRYATSKDLISYFKLYSPLDKHEIISKLFESKDKIE
ncbi:MAG: peptidase M1 [Tenacibaculum sp.]|nr:peptidase M1 [Tenacibaculum sp.]